MASPRAGLGIQSEQLEGIVEAGEYRCAFAAVADIDETYDERTRDATKSDPINRMNVLERIVARLREDSAEVGKGRDFDVELRGDGIEGKELAA